MMMQVIGIRGLLAVALVVGCASGTDPADCDVNATGMPGDCTCNKGYEGTGVECIDANECERGSHDCADDAVCTNTPGSFTCACKPGFEGNGRFCTDLDECAEKTDDCDAHATCKNTPGSYTCTCHPGYAGDGKTCTEKNECTDMLDDCDMNATCTDTIESYTCTCNMGYEGDGKKCTDIDECTTGKHDCSPNATCKNEPAGSFTCTCKEGFVGSGKSCADIDECMPVNDCHKNADCMNLTASYSCVCKTGFEGDGKMMCNDIDECQRGTAVCDPNATCSNMPEGSYTCTCKDGFTGNGKICRTTTDIPLGEISVDANAASTKIVDVTLYLKEPGNLLVNGGGEAGDFSSWSILENGGNQFALNTWGLFGTKSFQTSYGWDRKSQTVDLLAAGYTAESLDTQPSIRVSDWFRGSWPNFGDRYYFRVELRNASGTAVATYDNGTQSAPAAGTEPWQESTKTFSAYGTGVRSVYIEHGGYDVEYWAGHYGSVIDGASVVIGTWMMSFSNDNVTYTDWVPFASTYPWKLTAGPGDKTVYVRYWAGSGPVLVGMFDTILLEQ
jgi:hypothetical protein